MLQYMCGACLLLNFEFKLITNVHTEAAAPIFLAFAVRSESNGSDSWIALVTSVVQIRLVLSRRLSE